MNALRAARPEDAQAIADIYRPYVLNDTVSFETEAPTAQAMRARMAKSEGLYPWIVATTGADDGDIPIAYAYATQFRDRAAYRYVVETSIYVSGAIQGQGIGRTLYRALLETLARQGFVQAISVISTPNVYSIAMHEASGFSNQGMLREIGFKRGRWLNVQFWARDLNDATIPPAEPKPFSEIGLVLPR